MLWGIVRHWLNVERIHGLVSAAVAVRAAPVGDYPRAREDWLMFELAKTGERKT